MVNMPKIMIIEDDPAIGEDWPPCSWKTRGYNASGITGLQMYQVRRPGTPGPYPLDIGLLDGRLLPVRRAAEGPFLRR